MCVRSLAARFARPSSSFGFCAVACRACSMQYCCHDWLEWHAWTGFISLLRVSKHVGSPLVFQFRFNVY